MKTTSEIIEEARGMHPYKVVGDHSTYGAYNEAWEDACDEMASRLTDQWISVKDRLPEVEGNYLVYMSFPAGGTLIEIMEVLYFKKGLFCEFDNDMNRHKVDAKSWQPLPAPPKAEQ